MESTLREYKSPRKCFCRQNLATLATRIVRLRSYFAHNRRFIEVFDRYFHIPLPIVTKHELGLPFPPIRSHKIWCTSVHNFFQLSLCFCFIEMDAMALKSCDCATYFQSLFCSVFAAMCVLSLRLILDVSLVSVCDVYTNAVH